MLVVMLSSVMIVPAFAANTATLTVSDAVGAKGDIVEITVDVTADSYIVNGDFNLYYDTDYLRYVEESCEP